MEYVVKLSNSKQEFAIQERETILEAAIRAGVALNYGCSSGTCGLCKARVLEGQVKEIRAREFALSEAEKLQGYVLACLNTVCSDVEIDALTASSSTDIPVQNIEVKVRKIEHVADQVYRLIVQTPRTNRLRFLAGQYAELVAANNDIGSFAIASCPCEDRLIEFHLRALPEDPFTQNVATTMRPGDVLSLTGPFGEFVYDEYANRPVILFAFDTGFAAIKSLLEHITAQEQDLSIHLIWMSCGEDGLYMHNLCRSWRDAFDQFSYSGIALDKSFKQLVSNPAEGKQTVFAEHGPKV